MNQLRRTRGFAAGLALSLALLTAGFSYATVAQSASRMAVMGSGAGDCSPAEASAASILQGESFALDVQGLTAEEPVYLSVVFEDGRVFSPSVASIDGPGGLDGTLDMPNDPGFLAQTNSGGDFTGFIPTNARWPLGCHRVIAQGVTSQIQVSDYVEVLSSTPPVAVGGPLGLTVQSRVGQQPNGEQGVLVDIYGRRFMAGEFVQIRMAQPNGTIIELPQEVDAGGVIVTPNRPTVSTVGSFQMTITLGTTYQEGVYTIIASSGNGQSISAPFTLRRQAVTPRGFGLLNIANPPLPAPVTQEQAFQLQGKLFAAGEDVRLSLIQVNGVRRPLVTVQANQLGEFATDVTLGRQVPVGQHQLLAESISTVVTRALQLNLGSPVVPAAAAFAPITGPGADGSSGAGADISPAQPSVTAVPSASVTAVPSASVTAVPSASVTTEALPTVGGKEPPITPDQVSPTATVEPSPSASTGAAPATTDEASANVDPCNCNAPNFIVGSNSPGARAGEPSDLIPITSEATPADLVPVAPTPSF